MRWISLRVVVVSVEFSGHGAENEFDVAHTPTPAGSRKRERTSGDGVGGNERRLRSRSFTFSVSLFASPATNPRMNSAHVDLLLEFVRFASVSTDPARANVVKDCAVWLRDLLVKVGLQAEI